MGLNLVSAISSIYSGILSDFKYCKKFVVDLLREVAHLAKDSKQAGQILKLACCIFVGLVVVRVLTYLSNSIALSAFSDLILFDVLFLLVALVSIWVRQQTTDVKTYCFGYDRFEVIAVFASTILSILSSFYLLKEAIERLFEPVVINVYFIQIATKTVIVEKMSENVLSSIEFCIKSLRKMSSKGNIIPVIYTYLPKCLKRSMTC
ncbi:Zinc transporter 6-A [Echinococcus granulosus]|uniref:Zinc transporter 6-A n=1 Tax=Echinococcus granulosus TaxID=6210 RepID=W6UTF3_ECHGR|nr:Zinc transporter 6-A [Echinococcus granulosus]EUB64930.1 Zinc transporter 6-A [Echinococcus granulosus]